MTPTLPEPTTDYRRLARRVRCQLGSDPIGKQHALAALVRQVDRSRPAVSTDPIDLVDTGVRDFAKAVTTAMEGSILRFSRRQDLIRQAEHLGIRRFDANLLIAAVQHRLGTERPAPVTPKTTCGSTWRYAQIAVAVALQAAIFAGAWGLLHS